MRLFSKCRCAELEARLKAIEDRTQPYKLGESVMEQFMWKLADYAKNGFQFPGSVITQIVKQINDLQLK